ncbi:ATP-binding protein [Nocardia sp. NPDC003963]
MGDRSHDAAILPASISDFIGRERELETINALLSRSTRLITLIGPGGIGKTRLAAEAVHRCRNADSGRKRVYWVRLERLAEDCGTDEVQEEVAHCVIDTDFSNRSARDALVDALGRPDTVGTARTILVLDNCEHVRNPVADLVADLLEVLLDLTILTTSRRPIGWVDEYLVRVPPLSHRHAVTLFRQRAELTGRPIADSDQDCTVAEICSRVHHYPLYVQLAAARVMYQPPASILRELTGQLDDSRLGWSRPRTGVDSRHRGVTDVITWSYRLCSDKERLLFDRLSVFAAGYDTSLTDTVLEVGADLDAIQTICSDDDSIANDDSPARVTLSRSEIEYLLEQLADHSLLLIHMNATHARYSLVESLRVYARDRLHRRRTLELDEPARLTERHMRYYRDNIVQAAVWFNPTKQDVVSWARANWANAVIAIETSLTTPAWATVGLEICVGLVSLRVPFVKGWIREMRRWTQRCLDVTRDQVAQPTDLQVRAQALMVRLARLQGSPLEADRLLDDCVAAYFPDLVTGPAWRDTAEMDIGLPAVVEYAWGMELFYTRDVRAIAVLTRAHEKFDVLGDQGGAALSELFAALATSLLGTSDQAHGIARRYVDQTSAHGAPWGKASAEFAMAVTLAKHGDPAQALALARDTLAFQLTTGDPIGQMWAVQCRIWSLARMITQSLASGEEQVTIATEIAHLAGGSMVLRTKLGIALESMGPFADETAEAVAVARRILGSDYTVIEAHGSRLRPEHDEVQRFALGSLTLDTSPTPCGPPQTRGSHWHELSLAEQQVAILAAADWTNGAIADRRSRSVRTIDAQISAILKKLGIPSRDHIIDHIPRHTIDQVRIEYDRRPERTHRGRNTDNRN